MAGPLDPLVNRTMNLSLATMAAGTASSRAIWKPSTPGQIVAGWLSDDVGLAAGTTIFSTVALVNLTNANATMISIANSAGSPITVDTMNAMTLSTTVANTKFNAGDVIALSKTDSGGGVAITNACLQIDWIPGTYS